MSMLQKRSIKNNTLYWIRRCILNVYNSLFFQALYYTGNRSVALATNWIFDHPELDLETPLEEEIKRLQAKERTQHYPYKLQNVGDEIEEKCSNVKTKIIQVDFAKEDSTTFIPKIEESRIWILEYWWIMLAWVMNILKSFLS